MKGSTVPDSALFTPLTLRSVTARNRLWVSPMCQYSVEAQDGIATPWHLAHLGSFARGGAGLVMAEATAVVPEGRISPWDLGLWNDEQRDALAPIVDFIHSQGALAAIQLAHAGRKASTYRDWSGSGTVAADAGGWETHSSSPIAFHDFPTPREMSVDDIQRVTEAFAASTRRAVDAGFDVIEVHAAHGYLVHQFLSPLSNTRTDSYGGSLENRARILIDTVRAVRAEVGEDVPVLVRFSATDWMEPEGWTVEDTETVAGWAHEAGADMFDMSSGGLVMGAKIPNEPGYQVPFAARIAAATGVPTVAVGRITDPHQAEEIVASGQASAVMVGRQFLREPHFAGRAAAALGQQLDYWPAQYARGAFTPSQ